MKNDEIDKLAKKLWVYLHMNHKLQKSGCILVLGSHDIRVAERGAEIFLQGWAPLIVFSGGLGRLTKDSWTRPEADIFSDIAIKLGVPKERILIENKSTNTGENIMYTKRLLKEKNLNHKKFIVVQKPYMERRAYATFKKYWPEKQVIVTSPQIKFEDYPNEKITKGDIINIMVGDLQRVRLYWKKGFQIYQKIPEDVWNAYERLLELGFTKCVIRG